MDSRNNRYQRDLPSSSSSLPPPLDPHHHNYHHHQYQNQAMNGFHTLPHELQIQILLHLPPTAVFALRSVCTSWNEILSSPQIEHAINLSLLFPTTAPDLRSRLLRRTRLLRGDPVQIWGVDDGEETLTLYSEGFVVMAHSRCGGPGRLGIWDCRRPKGQDGCVTRIDLTALVKELYLELWEGRGLGAGETDEEGGEQSGGDRRAEIPFRLMTHYSWAENGSVLLVLGEPGNPRKPKHPKYVVSCIILYISIYL